MVDVFDANFVGTTITVVPSMGKTLPLGEVLQELGSRIVALEKQVMTLEEKLLPEKVYRVRFGYSKNDAILKPKQEIEIPEVEIQGPANMPNFPHNTYLVDVNATSSQDAMDKAKKLLYEFWDRENMNVPGRIETLKDKRRRMQKFLKDGILNTIKVQFRPDHSGVSKWGAMLDYEYDGSSWSSFCSKEQVIKVAWEYIQDGRHLPPIWLLSYMLYDKKGNPVEIMRSVSPWK